MGVGGSAEHPLYYDGSTPGGWSAFDDGDRGAVERGLDPGRAHRGVRDDAATAAGGALVPADAAVLHKHVAALDAPGRADPSRPPAFDVPQLLRPPVAAAAAQPLGPGIDHGLRVAAVVG